MRRIYLDHHTATRVRREVIDAMAPWHSENFGAPSCLGAEGAAAKDALARAREQFVNFVHASDPSEIIFTSSGSEAANLAIKGAACAHRGRRNHLVYTAADHPAVLESIEFLKTLGFEATQVPVDRLGLVSPECVREAITDQTFLVCVHHANHETGAVQPIESIGEIVFERGALLFVDATTSNGWAPIDAQAWRAAFISLSPHRFAGPKGSGVLFRNRRTRLRSLVHGGAQEHGYRAGTENIPAIVGAGIAAELAAVEVESNVKRIRELQQRLWKDLLFRVPYIQLHGPPPGAARLPHMLNISFEFAEGEGLALALDMKGVAVNSGAACVTKAMEASRVLSAMGVDRSLARSNLLISLSSGQSADEVRDAGDKIVEAVNKLRDMSPEWEEFKAGQRQAITPPPAPRDEA